MASLQSMLLPVGLFLYLRLQFSLAIYPPVDICKVVDNILIPDGPALTANADHYEPNLHYTIRVPAKGHTSSVVMRSLDQDGTPVGTWVEDNRQCENHTALYHQQVPDVITTGWIAPNLTNITEVNLQAYVFHYYHPVSLSTLKLHSKGTTTVLTSKYSTTLTSNSSITPTTKNFTTSATGNSTTSTTEISTTSTTKSPTTSTVKNPTTSTAKSPMTSNFKMSTTSTSTTSTTNNSYSFANRVFNSSITEAISILFVFLTSKFLF
ncbi:placenta-expressed transcript 1 protein [Nycticebus coucang]|uniref:placenta-expressed transcript 1 protein n=1 Tax=Nycticebus coucang TaxID=9470 RepID=UPI00234DD979|nr:placenta-expressed transcript 1 protein [Nycticebus coucang]